MKKFVISAVIKPTDDSITLEEFKRCLNNLGMVNFTFESEVECVDTKDMVLPKSIWIYISSDDSEPYVKVAECGDNEGDEIGLDELKVIQEAGVCTKFFAKYPRAERYGAPSYSVDDDFAEGVVGSHGFRVPLVCMNVHTEDSGDDSCENIWLKIAMPAEECLP